MDPTTFKITMNNLHVVPCANLIFQHFTTTSIEFNMHLVTMEMIVVPSYSSHMD
jgi:hypothetical protein